MTGYLRRLLGRMIVGATLILATTAAMAAEASPLVTDAVLNPAAQEISSDSSPIRWGVPWDQTTPYRKDDTVVHRGRIFISIQDNFMEEPGASTPFWKQLPGKQSPPPVRGGAPLIAVAKR
jgi:hypothetical protein